jgi:hypothetical protein
MSSVLAFLYWLSRYGLDNPGLAVLNVLSIGYILLIFPHLLRRFLKTENLWLNYFFLSIYTLLFLTFLGYISSFIGISLLLKALFYFGFFLLFIFLYDYFFNFFKKSDVLYAMFFLFFSSFVAFAVWGTKLHSPLFTEKIVLGSANADTLSFSATANLIKTYDMPSTGVDGLPYLPYHWGSNAIFAFFSSLSGVSALTFYNLGFPVIFIPFYFINLLSLVSAGRRYKNFGLRFGLSLYVLLSIIYIEILPSAWREGSVGLLPPFSSETHLMGMSFLFLILGSVLAYFEKRRKAESANFHLSDYFFLFLFLPALFGLLGIIKIFWLPFLAAVYGYLFFRLGWWKRMVFWINGGLLALFSAGAAGLVLKNEGMAPRFLSYIRDSVSHEMYAIFFLYYFIWLVLFIFLFFLRHKVKAGDLRNFIKEKKHLEIELIIFIVILAVLPGTIFFIPHGNAIYFFDFQRWMCLVLALIYWPAVYGKAREAGPVSLRRMNLGIITAGFFFLAFFSYNYFHNYFKQAKLFFGRNITTRSAVLNSKENFNLISESLTSPWLGISGIKAVWSLAMEPYGGMLNKNPRYQFLKILEEIDRMPISGKKETCIYIPRSNMIFWKSWETDYSTKNEGKMYLKIPLIVPSVSGLAMINGLPKGLDPDVSVRWYGYGLYNQKEAVFDRDLTAEEIKALGIKRGFKRIIVIRQAGPGLKVDNIETK